VNPVDGREEEDEETCEESTEKVEGRRKQLRNIDQRKVIPRDRTGLKGVSPEKLFTNQEQDSDLDCLQGNLPLLMTFGRQGSMTPGSS
jgi:hypothetical protein